jgi:hypothetical protein
MKYLKNFENYGKSKYYTSYGFNLVDKSDFDFEKDFDKIIDYWKNNEKFIKDYIKLHGGFGEVRLSHMGTKELIYEKPRWKKFLNLMVEFNIDSKNEDGLDDIKLFLMDFGKKWNMYLDKTSENSYPY